MNIPLWRFYLEEALPHVQEAISTQTGFLHFHPKSYRGETSFSIPLLENLLAVLFLLRTKHQEYVIQAKELMNALVSFQITEEGGGISLPITLQNYPKKSPDSLLLTMMVVLMQIKNDFSSVLGGSLLNRVEKIFYAVLAQSEKREWAIRERVLLHLVKRREGEKSEDLEAFDTWLAAHWWKDLRFSTLLCLLLDKETESFHALFFRLKDMWHAGWKKNISYGMNTLFSKTQAVPTLFEYYMSCIGGEKIRSLPVMPYLLDVAWINPHSLPFPIVERTRKEEKAPGVSLSIPSLEMKVLLFQPKPHELYGFHPIRFVTEHFSPVIHFSKANLVQIEQKEREIILFLEGDEEAGEESLFQFFIEAKERPVHFLSAESKKYASFWKPGEHVRLAFDRVSMKCHVHHPDAYFHLRKGDRPGQLYSSEEGFDWILEASCVKGSRRKKWQVVLEWST